LAGTYIISVDITTIPDDENELTPAITCSTIPVTMSITIVTPAMVEILCISPTTRNVFAYDSASPLVLEVYVENVGGSTGNLQFDPVSDVSFNIDGTMFPVTNANPNFGASAPGVSGTQLAPGDDVTFNVFVPLIAGPNTGNTTTNMQLHIVDADSGFIYSTVNSKIGSCGSGTFNVSANPLFVRILSHPDGAFINCLPLTGDAQAYGAIVSKVEVSVVRNSDSVIMRNYTDLPAVSFTPAGSDYVQWNLDWTAPIGDADGTSYSVMARMEDNLGNASIEDIIIVYKDSTGPNIGFIQPVNFGFVTPSTLVKFSVGSVGASVNNEVTLLIDGSPIVITAPVSVSGNTNFYEYLWNSSGSGPFNLCVQAEDIACNQIQECIIVFSSYQFTQPLPIPGGVITVLNDPIPYATSVNSVLIGGFPNTGCDQYQLAVDGVIIPVAFVGPDIQVPIPTVEGLHNVSLLHIDTCLGTSNIYGQGIVYDVTKPTISSHYIPCDLIGQDFSLDITVDDLGGSAFGISASVNQVGDPILPGVISRIVLPTLNLQPDGYNVYSQILTIRPQSPAAVGTYSATVMAMDNAGNRSDTYNITCLEVSNRTGLIDETRPITAFPNPWNPNETARVKFTYYLIENPETVDIYIYNSNLELQKILKYQRYMNGARAGYNDPEWSGKNKFRNYVGTGVYLFVIVAKKSGETDIVRKKFMVIRR